MMFYETKKNDHGLPYNPFKSCIVPRPIGWITSLNENGILNLAPYSYFNAVSDKPPMIMFAATTKHHDGGVKDTLRNAEMKGEFVVNITPYSLSEEVNITATDYDRNVSEVEQAKLEILPSNLIETPRIKGCPIHLECIYHKSIQLPLVDDKRTNRMVIATVVGIHIDDNIIENGKIDVGLFNPIARLGYMEYSKLEKEDIFELERQYTKPGSIVV